MIYLSKFLAKLFSLSFLASGSNYIIAMILFTLLTKILLLPIGIWTQKNGIKMVQMRPYLNLIKVKHFGDKDTIADETAALYKAKKYHPLLGTLPLIIQITGNHRRSQNT